jgi:4-hydroxy-tetrahydrodipicolinate synthase
MKKTKKYSGVVVPMVTPVTESGAVDLESVDKIIDLFSRSGVSALLMGTTGEGNSVSQAEALRLVSQAVKASAKDIDGGEHCTIYVNLTGNCFSEQVEQASRFAEAGAEVIVATLPTYYALTPQQMENYYERLADSVERPLMLYNILATTHMSIPVEVISRLADHPNIVGLKDSERDMERMKQCIALAQGRKDFCYFCGWAAQSASSLAMGGDGIVPSTGNFVPRLFRQLYDAAIAGDNSTAQRLQDETDAIARIYQKDRTLGQSLAALKVMMQTKGLCQPYMLMPLTRLSADEESIVMSKCRDVVMSE